MTDSEINDFIKQRKEDALAYEGISNFKAMYKEYTKYLKDYKYKRTLPDDFEDYFFDELFILGD